MSHRQAIVSLVLTMLLGMGVGGATRQALVRSHQQEVSSGLSAANGTAPVVAEILADLQRGAIDEEAARGRLALAIRAGRRSLAPLVAGPRLRGSFLEARDADAYEKAMTLDRDLEELAGIVDQRRALSPVAYQAVRLLEYAPARGGIDSADPGLAARLRALWLRAYADDLHQVDAAFHPKLHAFEQWRAEELQAWADAGRWDELALRVREVEVDARRTRDQLGDLPVPQEAYHVGEKYRSANGHVERALESLGEFAAAKASRAQPPRAVEEQLALYRAEREQALAALRRLVGESWGSES